MNRKRKEREIVEDKFPAFSQSMADVANSAHNAHNNAEEVDEFVIDAVWEKEKRACVKIILSEFFEREVVINSDLLLPQEARAVLLSYLDRAQAEADRLSEIRDDDQLDAEYEVVWKANISRRDAVSPRTRRLEQNAFFNEPTACACFDNWLRLPSWSLEEATALLLRKDPSVVNLARLATIPHQSPFVKQFRNVLDLLERAATVRKVKPKFPADFVGLANSVKIHVPAELSSLAPGRGKSSNNSNTARLNKTYRLLAAILVKNYDLDLSMVEEKAIKSFGNDILADLVAVGFSVDTTTMVSILKESLDIVRTKEVLMMEKHAARSAAGQRLKPR